MPYSSDYCLETKNRIIKSARRLPNRHGFDSVTIEQMADPAFAGEQAARHHGH